MKHCKEMIERFPLALDREQRLEKGLTLQENAIYLIDVFYVSLI